MKSISVFQTQSNYSINESISGDVPRAQRGACPQGVHLLLDLDFDLGQEESLSDKHRALSSVVRSKKDSSVIEKGGIMNARLPSRTFDGLKNLSRSKTPLSSAPASGAHRYQTTACLAVVLSGFTEAVDSQNG